LKQAKEREARVLLLGDTLDAMQGRNDPRASKDDLLPELSTDEYMDAIVDDAANQLGPWADIIDLISLGNHEDAARKHYGTNLAKRLAKQLGAEYFGWAGFIRFRFSGEKGPRTSRLLYFHHGAGGGGEVTRGVIKTARRQVYQPDADIIATGHIHEQWLMVIPRVRVSDGDILYNDSCYHVQLPTYKNEWHAGAGWAMGKEMPPKPAGAWWMKFSYDGSMQDNIAVNFEMAL